MVRSGDFFNFHFDRDNNSTRKGEIVAVSMMMLCILIFAAVVAQFMLFQGEMTESTKEEKRAAILHIAGLAKSETQDKESIETLYRRYIIQRHVNLDSSELVAGSSMDTVWQKCEKLAPERDPTQVRQRYMMADAFFVKDKNSKIQQVVIPVTDKGVRSMTRMFLALGLDGRTVRDLYYYQQRETPFLGTRVEDASWYKRWPGKQLLDSSGRPTLKIVQDKPGHVDEYTINGISDATLTSTGIKKSVNYWMRSQGHGQFL